MNGHERVKTRDSLYFERVVPYNTHTNIPCRYFSYGVHVYSFALRPEDHQPSGTCNMSRIDQSQLQINNTQSGELFVFARNYNILRIVSGMGGLTFSN